MARPLPEEASDTNSFSDSPYNFSDKAHNFPDNPYNFSADGLHFADSGGRYFSRRNRGLETLRDTCVGNDIGAQSVQTSAEACLAVKPTLVAMQCLTNKVAGCSNAITYCYPQM